MYNEDERLGICREIWLGICCVHVYNSCREKEKKDRRRRDKVATELSNDLENAFGALGKNEKYDFDKDFEM